MIKAVTFDCYGTLVDWDRGMREFFMSRFRLPRPRAVGLAQVWEEAQWTRIHEPYRNYRVIMAESLAEACRALQLPYVQQDLIDFVLGLLEWPVFPDVGALQELRPRKLAILSNMDTDLLQATIARFPLKFEGYVSAEHVRSYKPSPAHFKRALEFFDLAPSEVCHCAFGVRYDLRPARELGMRTVYVRRRTPPPDKVADAVVESLEDLSPLLAKW